VIKVVNDFQFTHTVWNIMGASIATDAYLSASAMVLEVDLLKIGSGSFIEDMVTLFGHSFQMGHLGFVRVTIGENCQVGVLSVLLPSSVVGNGVQIEPLTQIMGGEHLSENSRYGGNPKEYLGWCIYLSISEWCVLASI